MRGRMTVLQFLVILTVKSQIHHHSRLTLPLSTYSGYEGRRPDPNGRGCCERVGITACWIAASRILVFQKMGPLQHLHVALIDFKCGAEADGQTGQYVAALHEQEGLAVNFLMGQRAHSEPRFCGRIRHGSKLKSRLVCAETCVS